MQAREPSDRSWRSTRLAMLLGALLCLGAVGFVWQSDTHAFGRTWFAWIGVDTAELPPGNRSGGRSPSPHGRSHDYDGDHDDHHDDGAVLELSEQARRNIGLRLVDVSVEDFARTITVPGLIAERPGRTSLSVSAPLSGIIQEVLPLVGEAVPAHAPLVELRLTHDELVERQRALLLAIEQRDVVQREIARLEDVTSSGVVPGRALLERQYELQTVEAVIRAERQALLLHGLSVTQVEQIIAERRLLSTLRVFAPPLSAEEHYVDDYHVVELSVRPGDHVSGGTQLALLADHCELYVEGRAFEQDAAALQRAADADHGIRMIVREDGELKEVSSLKILYIENRVDRESRALRFFVGLPNQMVQRRETAEGRRFHGWRFKPGQRVELLVPVEWWKERVVLPVEAVVQEGVQTFVFQQDGDVFLRREIHVEHRDQRRAVIAADGTLAPGDRVVAQGAYQLHLALKQRAHGGAETHAHHH